MVVRLANDVQICCKMVVVLSQEPGVIAAMANIIAGETLVGAALNLLSTFCAVPCRPELEYRL